MTKVRTVEVYQCVACGASLAAAPGCEKLICASCRAAYPIKHGVLDTLGEPRADVERELRGIAIEQGYAEDDWAAVKLRHLPEIQSIVETRFGCPERGIEPEPYYDQIWTNFLQACSHLPDFTNWRVLEIGAENDYPFLRFFRERQAQCFAVNIHFEYAEPDEYLEWPEKTLADMNQLPFACSSFDLITLSATTHHSPDLGRTIAEIARVLKPGGYALIINDQVSGWIKHFAEFGGKAGRNELIHENEYSVALYHRLFKAHALTPHYLFSAYHDNMLRRGVVRTNRFAALGRILSCVWKNTALASLVKKRLLWPAHIVFGFPLNVVLQKHSACGQASQRECR
ncbi:MAG TPA: class I SAM-dependent methyltransferase [Oligoflexia bacterium]|nr:class I SAM-dependent methyltransferase [Oligoflexia bacterium]